MTVLRLEAKDIRALEDGINFKKNQENGKCYIIYKGKDKIRACVNQCKHQGGLFIKDIEDMDGRWVNPKQHNRGKIKRQQGNTVYQMILLIKVQLGKRQMYKQIFL